MKSELPELPMPRYTLGAAHDRDETNYYTADQMRDYAAACVAALPDDSQAVACEWHGQNLGSHTYIKVLGGQRCTKCKHEITTQPVAEASVDTQRWERVKFHAYRGEGVWTVRIVSKADSFTAAIDTLTAALKEAKMKSELPELPEPMRVVPFGGTHEIHYYTADQMRDYAAACVAALPDDSQAVAWRVEVGGCERLFGDYSEYCDYINELDGYPRTVTPLFTRPAAAYQQPKDGDVIDGYKFGQGRWLPLYQPPASVVQSPPAVGVDREDLYDIANDAFNDVYDGAPDGGGTRAALRYVVDCVLGELPALTPQTVIATKTGEG